MSNYLAFATVTATLRRTLQASLEVDVPGAKVTALRPSESGSALPTTGVNIYLYQVTPNPSLRNQDLPSRSSGGQIVQRPQVAVDLHYILTFYGEDSDLRPQRLLGSVVRTLHSQPILTRQMIKKTTTDQTYNYIANSNLADAVETVKITPVSLSLEELSKLWSVFFQTAYRLSVAYLATVVMIESEDVPQTPLPVLDRNVYVVSFHQPVIERIRSKEGEDQPILAESNLTIAGKNLKGGMTRVSVGGIEITPVKENLSNTQIDFQLPPGLKAGVQGLQIIHQMLMGTPPMPHKGVESNIAAFVLRPFITKKITVSNLKGSGSALRSADLTLNLKPIIGKEQRMVLLMNEMTSGEAASYSFVAGPRKTNISSIKIHIKDVKAGNYLVRVSVDGAQSPLTVDTDTNSPTYNQYIEPKVTIS